MKKYKLVNYNPDTKLWQIKALRNIPNCGVTKGNLGGWVAKEENLSHEGDCWVYENARVFGDAQVFGNARVFGDAQVFGNARVYENARVFGDAQIIKCFYIQQPKYSITCTNTHVFIGCKGHTWEIWEKEIQSIGILHGYAQEEIDQTATLLTVLAIQLGKEFNYEICESV